MNYIKNTVNFQKSAQFIAKEEIFIILYQS